MKITTVRKRVKGGEHTHTHTLYTHTKTYLCTQIRTHKHTQTHCKRCSTRQLLGMTHLWMIFDGDVDLLCVDDGRTVAVRQDERLLDVAVDLEQVASHLADL